MKQETKIISEITLKMLFDTNIIDCNTIFYSDSNPIKIAKINTEGCMEIYFDNIIQLFNYPSGAARKVVNRSVNGWTFWKVKINGELKNISELRKLYIE